jgi:hypothetical protein
VELPRCSQGTPAALDIATAEEYGAIELQNVRRRGMSATVSVRLSVNGADYHLEVITQCVH